MWDFDKSLVHCTKFREELKFKVRYRFPLGYPFWEKMKATKKQEHEKKWINWKKRKKKGEKKEKSVNLVGIVTYL